MPMLTLFWDCSGYKGFIIPLCMWLFIINTKCILNGHVGVSLVYPSMPQAGRIFNLQTMQFAFTNVFAHLMYITKKILLIVIDQIPCRGRHLGYIQFFWKYILIWGITFLLCIYLILWKLMLLWVIM